MLPHHRAQFVLSMVLRMFWYYQRSQGLPVKGSAQSELVDEKIWHSQALNQHSSWTDSETGRSPVLLRTQPEILRSLLRKLKLGSLSPHSMPSAVGQISRVFRNFLVFQSFWRMIESTAPIQSRNIRIRGKLYLSNCWIMRRNAKILSVIFYRHTTVIST